MNSFRIYARVLTLAFAAFPLLAVSAEGDEPSGLVPTAVLDTQRGGQAFQIGDVFIQGSSQNVSANLNGNALQAGVNGSNSISNGVLSGASGVNTLIQNSGNQVVIQNSTIINLMMN